MSSFRNDPLSGRWVIIAEGRKQRPTDFSAPAPVVNAASTCPFCEGNETTTPPEVYALRPQGPPNATGWEVRVVPNKYPAVRHDVSVHHNGACPDRWLPGQGQHEVIVDSPHHERGLSDLPTEHVIKVVQTYRARLRALYEQTCFLYAVLFKNKGKGAGASLSHPHTQVMALPFVPPEPQAELHAVSAYHEKHRACLVCDTLTRERNEDERVVEADEHFVVLCPFASRFPYEMRLFPQRHAHTFLDMGAQQQRAFARVLQRTLQRLEGAIPNVAYNVVLHTSPNLRVYRGHANVTDAFHWHLDIFPRLTTVAGFEWGSGVFINPVQPESAAVHLRRVALSAVGAT